MMTKATTKPTLFARSMPFRAGPVHGTLYGGPFNNYVPGERRLVSVKMAVEIDKKCDISVPTEDFSVPSVEDMKAGVSLALQSMFDGNDIYVGCMGGIGRTGLFMGCMAKVMQDYTDGDTYAVPDPVKFVRATYLEHALETKQQQDYCRSFDTSQAITLLRELPVLSAAQFDKIKKVHEMETQEIMELMMTAQSRVMRYNSMANGTLWERLKWAMKPERY